MTHTLRLLAAGAAARRLALGGAAPPYARLAGCPTTGMRVARLGLLIDRGFVIAHGGRDAALLAAAESVRRRATALRFVHLLLPLTSPCYPLLPLASHGSVILHPRARPASTSVLLPLPSNVLSILLSRVSPDFPPHVCSSIARSCPLLLSPAHCSSRSCCPPTPCAALPTPPAPPVLPASAADPILRLP